MNAWTEAEIRKGPTEVLGGAVCGKLPWRRELDVYTEKEGRHLAQRAEKTAGGWAATRLEKPAEAGLGGTLKPGSGHGLSLSEGKSCGPAKGGGSFLAEVPLTPWFDLRQHLTLKKSWPVRGIHMPLTVHTPRAPGDTHVFLERKERGREHKCGPT